MASNEETPRKPETENNADEVTGAEETPKKEPPAQTNEEDSKPPATPTLQAPPTFEDDGTFALPPDESFKTAVPDSLPQTAAAAAAAGPANSKGAQIIMNRFSNWRQKANENATILYAKAKEAQAQAAANNQGPLAALRHVSGVAINKEHEEKKNADEQYNKKDGFMVYGDDDDDERKEKAQEAPSSTRSLPNLATQLPVQVPNLPTRKELRDRALNVATGLAESVDTYATNAFRGRYSGTDNPQPTGLTPSSPHTAAKESQTALILKSRAASHLKEILAALEPYQYVLLLGAGRLQVNLKNPYVKHQGTYVDYLVQGGAADKSGVVAVGDSIVKVGAQDVRKYTIADVPDIIAQAKRPVVLVLTTGIELEVERITYLDLAVAMMHQIRAKDEQQKKDMIASATKNKVQSVEKEDVSEEKDEEDKGPISEFESMEDGPKEEEPEKSGPSFEDVKIPSINTIEEYSNPSTPPLSARLAYKHLVGKRCNDHFSVTELAASSASDENFRAALRNAFLTCAVDGRKFPFLGRHLTMEQDILEKSPQKQSPALQQPNKNPPNALLMLFLELTNFSDLHGVTPASLRREVAERIAYKFFLPKRVGTGSQLEPPMFDFHHLVSDSVLRTLEAKLKNKEEAIQQDLFLDFQHAVVDALCGTTFLLFLVSNHCARMRGYLRNAAPHVNVPLHRVFKALTETDSEANSIHPGSKNYFLYILTYLMQLEKDPTSTLSTDGSTLLGRNGRRMVGAAGGLCCYIFIGRVIVPAIEKYVKETSENGNSETSAAQAPQANTIVDAFGQLWELYLAPGVGALEHTWKSKETKEKLEDVRAILRSIRKEVLSSGAETKATFAQKFGSDQQLLKKMKDLADYLLYDYAIHTHTKFREHIFHDWLCNEFVKVKKEKSKGKTLEEVEREEKESSSQLPELPSGCIKRLLRKVDLPKGVSPHKPLHSAPANSGVISSNRNADCALVFGSTVGNQLAVKMSPPGMDHNDIKRYTCQDVTLEGEKLPECFEEEMVPPTLESYAVLPPTRVTGFSEVTGNVSLSTDGWEVSMVDFSIPKAGSEEEPQSLFGVSLVFQRSSTARYHPRRISHTQLVRPQGQEKKAGGEATIDEEGKFASPLSFNTPSDDHWSTFSRNFQVSELTPIFNQHLGEKQWTDRVLQDESRDQSLPATVGVALVSRQNVVIAMRQALWMFLRDFSRLPEDKTSNGTRDDVINCGALVDLLGNFAHQDIEGAALRCILEPYLRAASAPWVERPLSAQKEEFERHAGQQLITSLPPIPLALLFVAALLEQKIILSSSRRSILFSATEALTGMLAPLKWCHLLVPLVPSALAKDLIQYPAPFILGMHSEEPAVIGIMNDLPMDVTLVDLDVGRVILAPEFAFDSSGLGDADPDNNSMSALRSQVLYLAQILGSHFGAKLFRSAWSCDNPSLSFRSSELANKQADYDILRSICKSFIDELLSGLASSCFWIEEEPVGDKKTGSSEPTVLFDEDKFFFIKKWREENGYEPLLESADRVNRSLALSMDGFNLVLECFVRCQSMNTYLSSQAKDSMAFSL